MLITKLAKLLLILLIANATLVCADNSLPKVAFAAVEISDTSDPAISKLVKSAARSIHTDPSMGRDLLIEALYKIDRGVDVSEYDYLWIQYGLLKSCFEPDSAEFTHGTVDDYVKIASLVLDFLDETTSTGIWQFTDLGEFQMEVYRVAGNGLAWQQLQLGTHPKQWQEALSTIERAVAYVRGAEDYYILDTKVRILLKLGGDDEAYQIVREVLQQEPNFIDFQDLKDRL